MGSWSVGQIIGIFVGAILVALIFRYRNEIQQFVVEVLVELKKVSWPTRKELMDSTWIVLISSIALAVFIGVTDFVLSKFLSLMINK